MRAFGGRKAAQVRLKMANVNMEAKTNSRHFKAMKKSKKRKFWKKRREGDFHIPCYSYKKG